jgi:MYXO-CTERM domain-containing protein
MDARWPEVDGIELSLAKGPTGTGTFKVAHGLTPTFGIYLDTPVFKGEISVDAAQILPLLPGGQPFNYVAKNSTKFAPWGFEKASMTVGATDLKTSQLFAISFSDLGKLVSINGLDDYIQGSFSFNAITKSTFTYQTNSTIVTCPDTCSPIASQNSTTKMLGNFENAMDFLSYSKGSLRYSGELEFLPVVNISKIGSFGISLSFPISVGLKVPYDSQGVPITFPNANVHIPLPNIYMDTMPLAFADNIAVGSQEIKTRTIENTGEMEALITEVTSTSSAFKVAAASTKISAAGSFDLSVTFKPPKPGKYVGKINIKTNDPDTPLVVLDVTGGKGAVVPPDQDAGATPEPTEDSGAGFDAAPPNNSNFFPPAADSGCGCRTTTTPSGMAVTTLALLGLGLALLRRNRRNS